MKKRRSKKDEPLLIAAIVAILLVLAVGVYFATRSRSKPYTPAPPPAKPQLKTKTWIHGVCTKNDPGNGTCKQANYSDGGIAFSQKYDNSVTNYTYNDVMKQCKDAMITCGQNFRNQGACCGNSECENKTKENCIGNCQWKDLGCNTGLLV
jgi:hypothetical protein